MHCQTTIARDVSYTGIGLHSGQQVTIALKAAPVDTGIVFCRVDLPGAPRVAAVAANVTSTVRATTVEDGEAKVFTIEHLLSAFSVYEVDNCLIEINAPEPPVGDGSALIFWDLLDKAGIEKQSAERKYNCIDRTYVVRDADKFVMILPYDGFRVSFTSVNPNPLVGIQYADIEITPETYRKEIAPARTIAYEKEVDALRDMGLGLGGTLDNVIVYNDEKWLNILRYDDELVRHKVLDLVGDLRLAGHLRGHVIAVKSSHALNAQLAKQISDVFSEQRGGNLL